MQTSINKPIISLHAACPLLPFLSPGGDPVPPRVHPDLQLRAVVPAGGQAHGRGQAGPGRGGGVPRQHGEEDDDAAGGAHSVTSYEEGSSVTRVGGLSPVSKKNNASIKQAHVRA